MRIKIMEWSDEQSLKFLELYQENRCLWDPKHKNLNCKRKTDSAWQKIGEEMGVAVELLKLKKNSLMASFRNLRRRRIVSIQSGVAEDEVFTPKWFAYDVMESFLGPIYKCEKEIPAVELTKEVKLPMLTEKMLSETEDIPNDSNKRKSFRRFISPESRGLKLRKCMDTMDNASNNIKGTNESFSNTLANKNDEDSCDLYGRLLAIKLKQFDECEQMEIMYEIDGILLKKKLAGRSNTSVRSFSKNLRKPFPLSPSTCDDADSSNESSDEELCPSKKLNSFAEVNVNDLLDES